MSGFTVIKIMVVTAMVEAAAMGGHAALALVLVLVLVQVQVQQPESMLKEQTRMQA